MVWAIRESIVTVQLTKAIWRERMRVSEGEVIEGRLPQKPLENGDFRCGKIAHVGKREVTKTKINLISLKLLSHSVDT